MTRVVLTRVAGSVHTLILQNFNSGAMRRRIGAIGLSGFGAGSWDYTQTIKPICKFALPHNPVTYVSLPLDELLPDNYTMPHLLSQQSLLLAEVIKILAQEVSEIVLIGMSMGNLALAAGLQYYSSKVNKNSRTTILPILLVPPAPTREWGKSWKSKLAEKSHYFDASGKTIKGINPQGHTYRNRSNGGVTILTPEALGELVEFDWANAASALIPYKPLVISVADDDVVKGRETHGTFLEVLRTSETRITPLLLGTGGHEMVNQHQLIATLIERYIHGLA